MAINALSSKASKQLSEIKSLLEIIENEVYSSTSTYLDGSSIGQHTRHVIEFFDELINGYETSIVSYDKRKRNLVLETQKEAAIEKINELAAMLDKPDKKMVLEQTIISAEVLNHKLETTYSRELIYNIEHTVHHMAFIKVAAKEKGVAEKLKPEFGYADSTILNRQEELVQR